MHNIKQLYMKMIQCVIYHFYNYDNVANLLEKSVTDLNPFCNCDCCDCCDCCGCCCIALLIN